MTLPRLTDHGSEIGLLSIIAVGVMVVTGIGIAHATDAKPFDPSAYLVVLTLIVGAIKERWTQRSVDRMGVQLGQSVPQADRPKGTPEDPITTSEVTP